MMNTSEISELYVRDISRLLQEVDSFPDDASLWRVLPGISNSAGNLVLHLEGNLREFIGRILGGVPFERKRDAEFSSTGLSRDELHARVDRLRETIPPVIRRLPGESLNTIQPRPISNRPISTLQYLMLLYAHLSYHLGQIDYLRRVITGGSAIAFTELPE